MTGWSPTATLLRAGVVPAALATAAVVLGRPDLLVLAAPLAVHAGWALAHRPRVDPVVDARLGLAAVREGEGTTYRVTLSRAEEVEHAVLALRRHRWTATRPAGGIVDARSEGGDAVVLELPVASLRWGRRLVGDGLVAATSPWAGWQWGPHQLPQRGLTTLPLPGAFAGRAPTPHPIGLVGTNPARRAGDGSELHTIRPFQPGDRLRRVQWRVSLRTGALHVTSTVSEEDASVLLVVDSGTEVGLSGGVHGRASSLDVAVRAAGAVAEHHLHRGDRVGLRVLGSTRHNAVPTAAGRRHLRILLETLAQVAPGENHDLDPTRMRFGVTAGSVVVLFSPMLSEAALATATTLGAGDLDVVVVDTLPADVPLDDDPRRALAWRMRLLEREHLLRRLERAGVPVVPWRGPGTLDQVLVRLGRRKHAPGVRR